MIALTPLAEAGRGPVNVLRIVKVFWAFDDYGKPVVVLDLEVEGEVLVKGVESPCAGTLKLEPGTATGEKGKKMNSLDPLDPMYPGVVHLNKDAVISIGWMIREDVGVGRCEIHEVYTDDGRLKFSPEGVTLYTGKYFIVLRLKNFDFEVFSKCEGKVLLEGSEKPFSVTLG